MDNRDEVREFLMSRRARLRPEQAGVPLSDGDRRVRGLRRREVAELANVSVEYYRRLERGSLRGVSEGVLEALARALQLSEAERTYLADLARVANSTAGDDRGATPQSLRRAVRLVLDEVTGVPVVVHNERLDWVGANQLARALYSPMLEDPARPANIARWVFLDDRSKDFYVDWEYSARQVVAVLRAAAGRNPYNLELTELIEEVSTRSEAFRLWWSRHDVWYHRSGIKRLRHPIVGELTLGFEVMEFRSDQNLTLFVYTVQPDSRAQEALDLLASLAATFDQEDQHRDGRMIRRDEVSSAPRS